MATVLRNRALENANTRHLIYFSKDSGGRASFEAIPNIDLRIVGKGRLTNSVIYASQQFSPNEISITSNPGLVTPLVTAGLRPRLVYEFHTSDAPTIQREIDEIGSVLPERIRVPSQFAAALVENALAGRSADTSIEVVANIVDPLTFHSDEKPARSGESKPLVWVGRLDKGKNPNDFARLLSMLPHEYVGEMVLSLEDGPDRLERFLGVAADLGVRDRLRLHSNFSQKEMAELYRWAAERGGLHISTSLAESFGYAVVESAACGLATVGYAVGPLGEHDIRGGTLVPVGSIVSLVAAVRRFSTTDQSVEV